MRTSIRCSWIAVAILFLGPGASSGPPGGTDTFDAELCNPAGQVALDAQQYDSARQHFESGLSTARQTGNRKARGVCEFYLGLTVQLRARAVHTAAQKRELLKQAKDWYESSLKSQDSTPGTIMNLARAYLDLGQAQRADELFRQAIAKAHAQAPLQSSYAGLLARQGRWQEAAQYYRWALVATPGDRPTRASLLTVVLEHLPASIAEEVWDAVEHDQTVTAQDAAFQALRRDLPQETRASLLAAVAAALARQHYEPAEFPSSSSARQLRGLEKDPVLGPGARQVLDAHARKDLPEPGAYNWWADPSPTAGRWPSRLDTFRALLLSMALKVGEKDLQGTQDYLELADRLAPGVPAPRIYGELAAVYSATGQSERLTSNLARWEELLGKSAPDKLETAVLDRSHPTPAREEDTIVGGSPELDPRDLGRYHLKVAEALEKLGISGKPGESASLTYQLTTASQVANKARDLGTLLAVGAAQERNGLRSDALESYKLAEFLAGKIKSNGGLAAARERLEKLEPGIEPDTGGSTGGGGIPRWASWQHTGDCAGFPESPCQGVVSLDLPELVPESPGHQAVQHARMTVQLGCQERKAIAASHPALFPDLAPHPSAPHSSAIPSGTCRRVSLNPQPAWLASAAWDGDSALLVADPLRGQLLRYSLDGALRQATSRAAVQVVDVHTSPAGYPVIQDRSQRFLWRGGEREGGLSAVHQWLWTGSERGFAVGDLQHQDGSWTRGLFRLSSHPGERPRALLRFDPLDPSLVLYRLGNPYLAGTRGRAYFLDLRSPASLVELSDAGPPVRRPLLLPQRLDRRPFDAQAARSRSAMEAPAFYGALERSRLPAGLYSSGERLYLLIRTPGPRAPETLWTLARIDPARGTVQGSVVLPTSAPHLTVAPGARHWAFIEKSRVEGWGLQEVRSVLFVPSTWIEQGAGTNLLCESGLLASR